MSTSLSSKPSERALRKPFGTVPPLVLVCESVVEGICAVQNDVDCMTRAADHLEHFRRLTSRLERELVERTRKATAVITELRGAATLAERLHQAAL
ncbi:MAG: hypothetical protein ACYC8W_06170 [Candidatus Tyrphobacter sp.]